MLEFQLSQHPFRFGLSEGIDPRQAPPGTLTVAENARWTKSGRIEKRHGLAAAGTENRLTTLRRLGTLGRNLVVLGGSSETQDYDQVRTLQGDGLPFGDVPAVLRPLVTWDDFSVDASSGVSASDFVIVGNRMLVVWRNGASDADFPGSTNRVFAQLIDVDTGAVIARQVVVATAASFRVAKASDGTVGIVTYDDSSGELRGRTVAVTDSSFTLSAPIVISPSESEFIDMKAYDGGFILASWDSANSFLRVRKCTSVFAVSYSTSLAAASVVSVAVEPLPAVGTIVLAYGDDAAGQVKVAAFSDTGASLTLAHGPNVAEGSTPFPWSLSLLDVGDAEHALLGISDAGYGAPQKFTTLLVDRDADALTSTRRSTWNVMAVSRVFAFGGRFYAYVHDSLTVQVFVGVNAYVVEVPTAEDPSGLAAGVRFPHPYVGKIFAGNGGWNRNFMLSDAHAMPDGSMAALLPFAEELAPSADRMHCANRLVRMSVPDATSDHERCLEVGGEMYIAAPVLGVYDGRIVFDYGWARSADMDVPVDAGGGSVAAGAYAFASTIEFSSNGARKHRSPAGYVRSFTVGAGRKINVPVFSVALQNKGSLENGSILISGIRYGSTLIYRTSPGGAVLNKLSIEPMAECEPVDTTAARVTVADNTADATARPALYTTGGVLDDEQPPGFVAMTVHTSRIFGIDGGRKTIWFSKTFSDDVGYAPGFSLAFRIVSDEPMTALASLDDKLVAFGSNSIRYMLGSGPAPNGDANDFTPLMQVQTDVGCTFPRSVVSMADGVMFASERGIHLLGRDLSVTWIGRPVREQLAAYPTVTSAVLVPSENQVRFTCDNGTSSIVLVYDYVEGQWSTYRYLDGARIADACMWNGRYTVGLVDGRVFVEDKSTCTDAGAYVPMTLETAWISAAGPVAFQSVRRFALDGESGDAHALTVSVGFDSDVGYAQTHTFAAGSPVTTFGPLESCDVIIGTRRKCQRVRFRIQDASPGPGNFTTGRGPSFSAMGLEVGAKKGFRKKPSTQVA